MRKFTQRKTLSLIFLSSIFIFSASAFAFPSYGNIGGDPGSGGFVGGDPGVTPLPIPCYPLDSLQSAADFENQDPLCQPGLFEEAYNRAYSAEDALLTCEAQLSVAEDELNKAGDEARNYNESILAAQDALAASEAAAGEVNAELDKALALQVEQAETIAKIKALDSGCILKFTRLLRAQARKGQLSIRGNRASRALYRCTRGIALELESVE